MPERYDDRSKVRDLIVMVRFQKGVKEVLQEAMQKSGDKTISAFVRRATWEYAKQVTSLKDDRPA